MGYSIDDLFDDCIKGTESFDDMIAKLKDKAQNSYTNKIPNLIYTLMSLLGDRFIDGYKEYLYSLLEYEDDEVFSILKLNGTTYIVGQIPKNYTLQLTREPDGGSTNA